MQSTNCAGNKAVPRCDAHLLGLDGRMTPALYPADSLSDALTSFHKCDVVHLPTAASDELIDWYFPVQSTAINGGMIHTLIPDNASRKKTEVCVTGVSRYVCRTPRSTAVNGGIHFEPGQCVPKHPRCALPKCNGACVAHLLLLDYSSESGQNAPLASSPRCF